MDGLNKSNCGFADLCKLPADKCESCKVDAQTSEFHKLLVCGAYTWEQILAMQQGKEIPHEPHAG